MTRKNTAFAAAAVGACGTAAATRIRRTTTRRKAERLPRGMCFRVASLADVDAGRDLERVVL
jgi:hypothetical protein